jgi:hypothetical protein
MQSACLNMCLLAWVNLRACRSGWHSEVQMCTELHVQLISASLSRNLSAKLNDIMEWRIMSEHMGSLGAISVCLFEQLRLSLQGGLQSHIRVQCVACW